jgi:hypothetical protein
MLIPDEVFERGGLVLPAYDPESGRLVGVEITLTVHGAEVSSLPESWRESAERVLKQRVGENATKLLSGSGVAADPA